MDPENGFQFTMDQLNPELREKLKNDGLLIIQDEPRLSKGKWSQRLFLTSLALAPVTFITYTALHEGSHALVAVALGAKVDEFYPFPGRHQIEDSEGHVYHKNTFGHVKLSNPNGKFSLTDSYWMSLSPIILDKAIIGMYTTLAVTGKLPKNKAAKFLIWTGAMAATLDLGNHFLAPKFGLSDTDLATRAYTLKKHPIDLDGLFSLDEIEANKSFLDQRPEKYRVYHNERQQEMNQTYDRHFTRLKVLQGTFLGLGALGLVMGAKDLIDDPPLDKKKRKFYLVPKGSGFEIGGTFN